MKNCLLILILILQFYNLKSQHTFSIVAVDSITGEIGSAGATCLPQEDGALYISDIVLNVGAIHTQAWWTTVNQNAARGRMEIGDSPQEIIDWLTLNDLSSQGGNITDRQYGVVDLNGGNPRSAAYTGVNNFNENGHRVGPGYAIQGNILISQDVLDDMEMAYLNTSGELSEKLMAVMQAAKRPGADVRCLNDGTSSSSAFIRVAKPTDTDASYGNLWLDINVWKDSGTFTGDPIDELQEQFNQFNEIVAIEESSLNEISIYPNPTTGIITIKSNQLAPISVKIFNPLGKLVTDKVLNSSAYENQVNLEGLTNGIYFIRIAYDKANVIMKKITLVK